MQYHVIPIAMICDENFVMQTCVALTSMRRNKASNTVYEIYVIMADCSKEAEVDILAQSAEAFHVHVIVSSVAEYEEIKQITHISIAGLLKFDICDMLSQYDKILYLDGDIIVRKDLQDLYNVDLQDNYVACVVHSLGIVSGEKKMNSGVMLLNAKKIREENTKKILFETRKALGDRKSMDQETFQIVFADKKMFLEPKYNIMMDKIDYEKKYYSINSYNQFYGTTYKSRKEILDSAVIMHYTGAVKPWKYRFAKGFNEWFKYYYITFDGMRGLQLEGRMSYLREQIKQKGIRYIYWALKDKMLAWIGEFLGIYLDKSYEEWN